MSTAFLVDNILNDKEENIDSILSDTESETNSDLKDSSICDSPRNDTILSHNSSMSSNDDHIIINNDITEDQVITTNSYTTMIHNGENCNSERKNGNISERTIELCCNNCGSFYSILNNNRNHIINYRGANNNFRCDKCGGNNDEIRINESKETILKDNSSKPVLKFSVSAILGDNKDGVRVRNGKNFNN